MRLALLGALSVVVALFIPEPAPPELPLPEGKAFEWNRDEAFSRLEEKFANSRNRPCPGDLSERIKRDQDFMRIMAPVFVRPADENWDRVEEQYFELIAESGSCRKELPKVLAHRDDLRKKTSALAARWTESLEARKRHYRLVYGMRMATEELLLQMPPDVVPSLSLIHEERSLTPSAKVEGVEVHSGDLLVSRGGAPTSAFIARGSDYPGNFSHVALVHIDEKSKEVSVIESHIESGVGAFPVSDYLGDKKLRILVLRPRFDLPEMKANPMLPHEAATEALEKARSQHIPYDFEMNVEDPEKQFCSEVASSVYGKRGINLWQEPTRFSSPGLARWMASLGVRHLETHGPSDLEYDPHLRAVAEWHNPDELFDDHIDNAVIDVMLEYAEAGADLEYNWAMLPIARIGKAYSWVLNQFGAVGPVPEGMSATVALRAQWLTETHAAIVENVKQRAAQFEKNEGYRPPYWRLVEMAREAALGPLGELP